MDTKHGRLICGSEKENWTRAYYEPIPKPEDVTDPNLIPDIGIFSHSRGEATEKEPMYGQVAWEPFLQPDHFPSNSKAERLMLQKKILYDAWRYLVAKDPRQIAVIKDQLFQGSQKQKMLLKELDKARKAKSNAIKQGSKRKAKKSKNSNVARESIEKPDSSDNDSDDDSGPSSDSDDDNNDWRMPPPTQTTSRRRPGSRYEPATESVLSESELSMSGGRGVSLDVESNADTSPAQRPRSAAAQSYKRKSQSSSSMQRNVRMRREESGLFMTPRPTGEQRPRYSPEILDGGDLNGGLDENEAFAAAVRLSVAPVEGSNIPSQNAGMTVGEGFHRTVHESMPPEGGVDE